MGYKLSFNTLNGGKASINLIKKINFLPSMCDGVYLSFRVPTGTTTAELSFLGNHYSGPSTDYWNALNIRLSEPVDEYITVNFDSPSFKDTIIIMPGKTSATGSKSIHINDIEYFGVKTYVYIGQRLVYSFTDNFKDFKNNYFGVRNYYPGAPSEGNITEPKEKLSLTTNNETIYVYPLCKNSYKEGTKSFYLPCFRYKEENYIAIIKIQNNDNDITQSITNNLPDEIKNKEGAEEQINNIKETQKEQVIPASNSISYEDGNGNVYVYKNFLIIKNDGSGDFDIKQLYVSVNSGEYVREIPVRDENGNLIGYHLITVDGDGNITNQDSVAIDGNENIIHDEIRIDGDKTIVTHSDGSITVNWGTNNPDGNNSNTYYPDGDGGWVDEKGNSVDLPSDITGGDNPDSGDSDNPDNPNPENPGGDGEDNGSGEGEGNGDQSTDSGDSSNGPDGGGE